MGIYLTDICCAKRSESSPMPSFVALRLAPAVPLLALPMNRLDIQRPDLLCRREAVPGPDMQSSRFHDLPLHLMALVGFALICHSFAMQFLRLDQPCSTDPVSPQIRCALSYFACESTCLALPVMNTSAPYSAHAIHVHDLPLIIFADLLPAHELFRSDLPEQC